MDGHEMLASMKRRRNVIAEEAEQMRLDQEHWNSTHPDELPLDEMQGMDDNLASLDASIARMERRVKGAGR